MAGLNATIGITAHPRRHQWAMELADKVKPATIIWDMDGAGCEANSVRTFEYLRDSNAEWVVRLEDDVLVVDDFRRQLQDCLAVAPSSVCSLYLGRGRPLSHDGISSWQDRIARTIAKDGLPRTDMCWIMSPRLLSAQGVAIRTELIELMLERVKPFSREMPIDDAVSEWCLEQGIEVAHTWPSLVQHRTGPTIIDEHHDGQPRTELRVAWLWDSRESWNSSSISL